MRPWIHLFVLIHEAAYLRCMHSIVHILYLIEIPLFFKDNKLASAKMYLWKQQFHRVLIGVMHYISGIKSHPVGLVCPTIQFGKHSFKWL